MRITRRDFLKYCSITAGALGLSASTMMKLEKAMADVAGVAPDVIWISGQSCSGCITSLLNSAFYTDIGALLLSDVNLLFQETINATCGATVDGNWVSHNATENIVGAAPGYVLMVEGAIPTGPLGTGNYCKVGNLLHNSDETMKSVVTDLAKNAVCVLSIGTCSSFGGIPAAKPNPTGASSAKTILQAPGVYSTLYGGTNKIPVINVPGCPPHPDWIVGTVLTILASLDPNSLTNTLANVVSNLRLNRDGSPGDYYGQYQCNAGPCVWRYNNSQAAMTLHNDSSDYDSNYPTGNSRVLGASKWAADNALGCLGILGCKGRKTKADCSARKWNSAAAKNYGVNWCVGSRGSCHGCTSPQFPDGVGKFFTFR